MVVVWQVFKTNRARLEARTQLEIARIAAASRIASPVEAPGEAPA
jgi:hypothetical protein